MVKVEEGPDLRPVAAQPPAVGSSACLDFLLLTPGVSEHRSGEAGVTGCLCIVPGGLVSQGCNARSSRESGVTGVQMRAVPRGLVSQTVAAAAVPSLASLLTAVQ